MNVKKYIVIKGGIIMNEQIKKQKLGAINGIEFIGGQITSRVEANVEKGDIVLDTIKVIPPKAIHEGKLHHDELYDLALKTEVKSDKFTKAGDIVIKLSTPYDAAYIKQEDEGIMITSFCAIIRLKNENEVLASYLVTYLNSEVFQNYVQAVVSGAAIPMMTLGKLKDFEIKLVTIEKQKQIAEYYQNICEKEVVMKKIIELEKEKLSAILGGENNGIN